MASSSSSSSRNFRYDVFLSFRGEDTRKTFVSHLYKALVTRGISTFKDDRNLDMGDYIPTRLRTAIHTSRFAILVISINYATSGWCLDELQMIMELVQTNDIEVIPIFYGVAPSDVRKLQGNFNLERYRYSERARNVDKWREALMLIANRNGKVSSTDWKEEAMMTNDIVKHISDRLLSMMPVDFDTVFGMEAHMEVITPLLDMDSNKDVRFIGIWGMGGCGKTTIAKYLYENFKDQFSPHYCFVYNVRETSIKHSLLYLQEQLISTILNEKPMKLWNLDRGAQIIKSRFSNLKVFIVLDDVNDGIQLSFLAKEAKWFGKGSRIIITTRDKSLLDSYGVNILYKVKCLDSDNSLRLLNHIAFEGNDPPSQDYVDLSNRFSSLSQGLPLALEGFGRYLRNKSLQEWQHALRSFEGNPHENIMTILRISYDGLDELSKAAFLHIACLFNGDPIFRVNSLLNDGGVGLRVLEEKSLINKSTDGCIAMHGLVEQTGRKIVRQESGNKPAKQRILWHPKDIHPVLARKAGTIKNEGMALDVCAMPYSFPIEWNHFQPMDNLNFLNVYNQTRRSKFKIQQNTENIIVPQNLRLLQWEAYPYTTLPSSVNPQTLVELNLCHSNLRTLWSGTPELLLLRRIDLTGCENLKQLPGLQEAKCLEELILEGCISLKKIPKSMSSLSTLKTLDLSNSDGVKNISTTIRVFSFTHIQGRSLRVRLVGLDFSGQQSSEEECRYTSLTNLSITGNLTIDLESLKGYAENLCFVSEQQEIPHRTMMLVQELKSPPYCFKSLDIMRFNYKKKTGPFECSSFSVFPWLMELNLINLNIKTLPDDIDSMKVLEKLDLSGNDFTQLPTTMVQLQKLKHVTLSNCRRLEALPELYQLETLTLSDCTNLRTLVNISHAEQDQGLSNSLLELWLDNCKQVESLSEQISHFTKLKYLDISRNDFESLPTSLKDLTSLVTLSLNYCKNLRSVTQLPSSVKFLYAHGCKSLETSSIPTQHTFHHCDLSPCPQWKKDFSQITRFPAGKRGEEVQLCACFKNDETLNTLIEDRKMCPILTFLKRLSPW